MKRLTGQNRVILNYLESGGSLSSIEALNRFQCFRLAARVRDLRKAGHDIQTKTVKEDGKKYAVYSLPKIQIQGELF